MTYAVEVRPSAAKAIRKLPPDGRRRIEGLLAILAEHPRPPAARKLVSRPGWRVRSGDYRLIYEIDDGRLVVVVVNAGHRREIYRER
ncbi:type II toxin-antitoxin system RelE family toxin [Curtobacterium pusillum]|uniref:type II toxin-antitoxin system RelE family toxin n=1 Tax=Curtobacterium pusillum TaxID=69373 RepID=UPI00119DF1F0|nr:type II toxin-antitoxin system RelE/ParE family toxin [Curtobacterium pusillum]